MSADKLLERLSAWCKWKARLTLTFLAGTAYYYIPDLVRYRSIMKEKPRRLMIVAHPDDEALFFSRILQSDNKDLVVFCLTNGYDPQRRREFYRSMAHFGVKGHIMKLPDQSAFSVLFSSLGVSNRIGELSRRYGACDTVYTHNTEGEYGHRLHRMIGRRVARCFRSSRIVVPVSGSRIGQAAHRLSAGQLQKKEYVFEHCYPTQARGVRESLPDWFYHEKLSFAAPPARSGHPLYEKRP